MGEFVFDLRKGNKSHVIANNIILAFENKEFYSINDDYIIIKPFTCSMWVIDGQHRLYGFTKLPKLNYRDSEQFLNNYKMIVTAIEADILLQAKLFTEINTYQKKINRNLLLDLYDYLELDDETGILKRIRVAKRLSKIKPFIGKVKVYEYQKGLPLTLATFVDYSSFRQIVQKYSEDKSLLLLKRFFNDWYQTFRNEWDNSKEYILCTNRGIRIAISLLNNYLYSFYENYKSDKARFIREALQLFRSKCMEYDSSFFTNERYKGLALGAWGPKLISEDWILIMDEALREAGRHSVIDQSIRDTLITKAKAIVDRELLELINELRKLILHTLVSKYEKWYISRVPRGVKDKILSKIKEDKEQRGVETKPIEILDIPDIKEIIIRDDNWKEFFRGIFKRKDSLIVKLDEINDIRNPSAHPRIITRYEINKLKIYKKEILDQVKNYMLRQEVVNNTINSFDN